MTEGIKAIIYPVKDLAAAKALYGELLGVPPIADQPYYVGYKIGGLDVGLDPNGHTHGVTSYWQVDDINSSLKALLGAGAEVLEEVKDVGGGRLVASLKDADGNIIGLLQDAGGTAVAG
jgi:predicted enzyme related to lactoylglutathione lyase